MNAELSTDGFILSFIDSFILQTISFFISAVKYFHRGAQIAILKVPRDDHKLVRAACTLLTQINNHPVIVDTIKVNGSARTCKISSLQVLRQWFNKSNEGKEITDSMLKKLYSQMEELRGMD